VNPWVTLTREAAWLRVELAKSPDDIRSISWRVHRTQTAIMAVVADTGATADEIAKHLGWPVSDVRRVMEGRRPWLDKQ
jgi:predicted transcriptional regulator